MIRSLHIFCSLVETQSFTEAAQLHYLTQPAVSQHLKALEEKLGQRLVERGRGYLRLTQAGQLAYEAGKEILDRFERLKAALQEDPKEIHGILRVAAVYSVGLYELQPFTAAFLSRYPKVDLQLRFLAGPEIYTALLANRIDLGFVDYPKPHPQLKIRFFQKEKLVLIVPSRHPWSKRKRIRIRQLNDQPFIAVQSGLPMREVFDETFRREKVKVHVVSAFDNFEIVKRAVEVGLGISIVPRLAVANEVKSGSLKQLDLAEGAFERTIGILLRKRMEPSLAARRFLEMLLPS